MKWLALFFCTIFMLHGAAQEICNNGKDDDQDAKIDLLDEDCNCTGNFIKIREQSIILNPSFEEHTDCPTMFSQMAFVKDWVQPSIGTSDYINTCGTLDPSKESQKIGKMPLPIPDGNGVVGIINGHLDDMFYQGSYKEYVGTVLAKPLRKNQTYILEVSVGFSPDINKSPPFELSIFGHTSRTAFPIDFRAECPSQYFPDWKMIGSTIVGGTNEWVKASIEFISPEEIHSIAVGPPCADAPDSLLYYYLDNLILYRKEDQGKVWLNISGMPVCDNTVTLTSNTIDESFNFQWFKNGIAVPTATNDSIILRNNEKDNGIYQLMVSGAGSCQLSQPYEYTHIPKMPSFADLGPDIFSCSEEVVTIKQRHDENSRFWKSFRWSDGSGNETFDVTQTGTYWLEFTTLAADGSPLCVTRDSIVVNFDLNQQLDLGPPRYICDNNPIQIGNSLLNGSHKWSTGQVSSTIFVNVPGTYSDTVNDNGCVLVGTVQVLNNPLKVDLGHDVEACDGKAVRFDPQLPAGTNYLWNTTYIGSSYSTHQSQVVTLQAEFNGCTKRDTVVVRFNPSPQFNLGDDTSLCTGLPLTLDASVPGAEYQWNTGSTTAKITPQRSGNFSVRVTGANGCYSDDTVSVDFQPLPEVELDNSLSLCRGSTIQIIPVTAYAESLIWNDGITNAMRNVSTTGIYYLRAENHCGAASDTIMVKDGGICKLIFANAFTPNGDGKNDVFPGNRVYGIEKYSLQIFNRWGQLVFSTKNIAESWNGIFNAQQAPAGSYTWRVEFKDVITGDTKQDKGSVLLIR